jgi:hypothetical protein
VSSARDHLENFGWLDKGEVKWAGSLFMLLEALVEDIEHLELELQSLSKTLSSRTEHLV